MSEQVTEKLGGKILTLYRVKYLALTQEDKHETVNTSIAVEGDQAFGVSDALQRFVMKDNTIQDKNGDVDFLVKDIDKILCIERGGSIYVEL